MGNHAQTKKGAALAVPFGGFAAVVVSALAALLLTIALAPASAFAASGDLDVSKSKTAANLDENYQSNVTLSLPAANYKPSIDVVLVIDDTHAGKEIFDDAVNQLFTELQGKENLNVNLGIVTFDAVARDWISVTSGGAYAGLVSISDANGMVAIQNALEQQLSYDESGQMKKVGGTNLEWPLEMAQTMLASGNGTEKHVVVFSDMYGYIYRGSLTVGGTTYENVPLSKRLGMLDGSLSMGTKYTTFNEVYANRADANETLSGFFRNSSWQTYWENYAGITPAPEVVNSSDYVVPPKSYSGFEVSTCLTYDRLTSLANIANVTIVNNDFANKDSAYLQPIKNEMLDALSRNGITVIRKAKASASDAFTSEEMGEIFTTLKNELVQLVDAGSCVIDEMGETADYNFDLLGFENMQLSVDGVALAKTYEGNECAFVDNEGEAQFKVTYYPEGLSYEGATYGECFKWDIFVPITKDQSVQLTYGVKLANPSTVPGTYGVYDADGSQNTAGLFTNNVAVLYPVDTTGAQGAAQAFPRPSVSYTVAEPAPVEPAAPAEPASPATEEPAKPTTLAQTGDPLAAVPFAAAAAAAACAVALACAARRVRS